MFFKSFYLNQMLQKARKPQIDFISTLFIITLIQISSDAMDTKYPAAVCFPLLLHFYYSIFKFSHKH